MSQAPPIPEEQRRRRSGRPDQDPSRRPDRDVDPEHQGQSANTRQNTHRSGKTQDR
jgi:hypothetical protein